jgi:PAS domain S-box-containing protein
MDHFLALVPYAVASVTSTAIGLFAWRHRDIAASRAFAAVALLEVLWVLGSGCETLAPTLEGKVLWDDIQWAPTLLVAPAILVFGLRYAGVWVRRPRAASAALAGSALSLLGLVYTDHWHGLIRSSPRLIPGTPFDALHYDFGPGMWLCVVYLYGLICASLYWLLRHGFRSHEIFRGQARFVLIGVAVPLVGGILPALGVRLTHQQDLSPFSITISNVLICWGLFRFRLFDVAPLARDTVVENIGDAVFALDGQGRLTDVNRAGERILGLEAGSLVGRPAGEAFASWAELAARHEEGTASPTELTREEREGLRHFDLRAHPLRSRRGRVSGRVLVLRDVTERKAFEAELRHHRDRLEEQVAERTAALARVNKDLRREIAERTQLEGQLAHVQKMEAIGRLAGGVAHDFNNLLTAIQGYVSLLAKSDNLMERELGFLKEVRRAADRAGDLTRQLLAFSRKQVLKPVPLHLASVVEEAKGMLGRLVGEGIEIVTPQDGARGLVKADHGRVHQIVVNLVVNARDAMPRGGTITIETADVEGQDVPHDVGETPGPCVMLRVRDTGEGMDEETVARMWDPFFTTKGMGKGTGLGLSTVYGIVKQSGGFLHVESEPGVGTSFELYLPRTDETAVPADAPAGTEGSDNGSETILVVEDEDILRELAQLTLEESGYCVLLASRAEEAVDVARETRGRIDLLLSDVVLPGDMNGVALASRLEEERPGLRTLLMSGYTGDIVDRHLIESGNRAFIQKPFTPSALATRIREVLDA